MRLSCACLCRVRVGRKWFSTMKPQRMEDAWEREFGSVVVNWYPGHMAKSTRSIRDRLKKVDHVVEVRDARIPFSSANPELDALVGASKSRLVVLNKADLADPCPKQRQQVLKKLEAEGREAMFISSSSKQHVQRVVDWMANSGTRGGSFKTAGSMAMVVGMPNVGKSTLINRIRLGARGVKGDRAKHVAKVGARPGVTRQLTMFKIGESPPLFLIDTPGIMVPKASDAHTGLRLALTAAVPDARVGEDVLVRYMLWALNEKGKDPFGCSGYIKLLGLRDRSESVSEVVSAAWQKSGAQGKPSDIGQQIACRYLLKEFRAGTFGRIMLDEV
ncbi:unnamed protein product [Chrysoparadoxa australica]